MDRRSLLSASLATVVAVGVAPAALATPLSHFERAHSAWKKARSAFDVPLNDEASSIAITKVDQAFEAMLRAPARHSGDIGIKLDAMLIEYEGSEWDEDRVRLIAADAHRLGRP